MWQIFIYFSVVPPMVRFFSFSVALIRWCWQTSCVLNIQLLTCLLTSGWEFICRFHLVLLIVQDASSPISLSAVASCLLKSKITRYKRLTIGLNVSMMVIGALHSISFSLCVTVMMIWFHALTPWSQIMRVVRWTCFPICIHLWVHECEYKGARIISNIFGDMGPDTLVFNSWTVEASTLKLLKPSIFFHLLWFLQISNRNTCEVAISRKPSWSPSLNFLSHFAWVHLYPYVRCLYIQCNMQIMGFE